MRRYLTSCFVIVAALSAGPVFAQNKAKAQNVPEIPADIRPFLKLPPGLYMGEAIGVATNSKGHVFVYTRSANTRLFEFDQNGTYVREIGEGNYGFEFAHSVRVDPQDNIWVVDEGTNMVIKFNPAGRIVMVLGHRPEAVAGAVAIGRGPAAARREVHSGTPDRCRVGPAGQHLRVRRIHQSPGGEVRQERPVPHAGRAARRPARNPASSTRRTALPSTCRATSTSPTAPTHACRCSTTTWCREGHLRQHRRFLDRVHLARTAPVPVHVQLQSQRQRSGIVGHHRRDLQDGTGRNHHRQVRPCQQAAGRLPGRAHDGLPESERDHRGGNRVVARPEDSR